MIWFKMISNWLKMTHNLSTPSFMTAIAGPLIVSLVIAIPAFKFLTNKGNKITQNTYQTQNEPINLEPINLDPIDSTLVYPINQSDFPKTTTSKKSNSMHPFNIIKGSLHEGYISTSFDHIKQKYKDLIDDPLYVYIISHKEREWREDELEWIIIAKSSHPIKWSMNDSAYGMKYYNPHSNNFEVIDIININNLESIKSLRTNDIFFEYIYEVGKMIKIRDSRDDRFDSVDIPYFKTIECAYFARQVPKNYTGMWFSWHCNGKLRCRGAFINRKKDGLWINWFGSGKKANEGCYVNGLKEGLWTFWYKNGNVKYLTNYVKGVRKQ